MARVTCPGPEACDNAACRRHGCFGRMPIEQYVSDRVYDGTRPVSPAHAARLRKIGEDIAARHSEPRPAAPREPRDILPDLETIAAAVLGIAGAA